MSFEQISFEKISRNGQKSARKILSGQVSHQAKDPKSQITIVHQISTNLCSKFQGGMFLPHQKKVCIPEKRTCMLEKYFSCQNEVKINRKFRVPRKQGAHFLGARAHIQDFWVLSSSA
jgi:hypothetical protein